MPDELICGLLRTELTRWWNPFGFSKVFCEHKSASKCLTVLVFQADLQLLPAFVIFLLKFMIVHCFFAYDGVEKCFRQMYLAQKRSESESKSVGKTKM